MNLCTNLHVFLLNKFTICNAPSFCRGSAFGLVRTSAQNCMVFCSISFRFLHAECNKVCAAVTGDTKSSKISEMKETYFLLLIHSDVMENYYCYNVFTKFDSYVFIWIVIPQFLIGSRV